MRTILTCVILAVATLPAFAESDRAMTERIERSIRSEWNRQDCMWRETLRLTRLDGPSADSRKIAGLVAYTCSEDIRNQILQGITPATDQSQKHTAAFDQLAAQERALSIARQLKELSESDQTKTPNKEDSK